MKSPSPRFQSFALGMLIVAAVHGCATIREMSALQRVEFRVAGVSDLRLAGVDLSGVQSYEDLGLTEIGRLGLALAEKEMPLQFQLHLRAENPPTNTVEARLVRMEWTLFLQNRETVRGLFDEPVVLPPGEPQDIPIAVALDMVRFFKGTAGDLVELALALAGRGASPKHIRLEATPTIDTALGPIGYPKPIKIVSLEVGP